MPNWFSKLLGKAKETTSDSARMDQIKSKATEATSHLGQHSHEGEGAAPETAAPQATADMPRTQPEEPAAEGEGAAGTDTTPDRPEPA